MKIPNSSLESAARHNGGCEVVDSDGLNGVEGLVATGVRGTIEGVDACEGKWRVQGHDRLFSCARQTHARSI
jgi:hypothetical protein